MTFFCLYLDFSALFMYMIIYCLHFTKLFSFQVFLGLLQKLLQRLLHTTSKGNDNGQMESFRSLMAVSSG